MNGTEMQELLLTVFNCFLAFSPKISIGSSARNEPSAVNNSTFKTGADATKNKSTSPIVTILPKH